MFSVRHDHSWTNSPVRPCNENTHLKWKFTKLAKLCVFTWNWKSYCFQCNIDHSWTNSPVRPCTGNTHLKWKFTKLAKLCVSQAIEKVTVLFSVQHWAFLDQQSYHQEGGLVYWVSNSIFIIDTWHNEKKYYSGYC